MSKATPVEVEVVNGELVIRIGIECLARAVEHSTNMVITSRHDFAKSMAATLRDEAEDGSTAVHHMLDSAAEKCVENGEEGFDYGE